MVIKDWNIEEMTGYKPLTTFYTDFSIADNFGEKAVKETYNRAFKEWKDNIKYVTELAMALNWKIWEHFEYEGKRNLANLYDKLYWKTDEFITNHFKGEDLAYYFRTTD